MSMMSAAQVPDPHAVATDVNTKTTASVFAPAAESTPTLALLSPNSVKIGELPISIMVRGKNFMRGAVVVTPAGDTPSTVVYGPGYLTFTFDPRALTQAGTVAVQVRNPNGALSAAVNLTIAAAGAGGPATGATAGKPGAWLPAGCVVPATVYEMGDVIASPQALWTGGQYMQTQAAGKAGQCYWSGSYWSGGVAP